MTAIGLDSLQTRTTLKVGAQSVDFYSLRKVAEKLGDVSRLPFSMKVLLENLLRFEDGGFTVSVQDVQALIDWQADPKSTREIQYRPARVLLAGFYRRALRRRSRRDARCDDQAGRRPRKDQSAGAGASRHRP